MKPPCCLCVCLYTSYPEVPFLYLQCMRDTKAKMTLAINETVRNIRTPVITHSEKNFNVRLDFNVNNYSEGRVPT
jgi:hypothetical protein